MRTISLFLLFALAGLAQTTRSVTLNWTDTKNPAGTTYNIFRSPTTCDATLAPTRIATAIAPKTYTDPAVALGSWCYYVTAVYGTAESTRSPLAAAVAGPFPPEGITVVVSVSVTVGSRTPTATTQTAWAEVQKLPDPPPAAPTAQVKE